MRGLNFEIGLLFVISDCAGFLTAKTHCCLVSRINITQGTNAGDGHTHTFSTPSDLIRDDEQQTDVPMFRLWKDVEQ